ncbi:hypothetical protein EW146_g8977 [Bondarzewia mesenterica]|uniref:Uncharacterized protein n=1 Tax=Bondarzewia mesenterica TaxID=1095465 RepID=A0A4S4LBG2_9AGAM|nr:hypothetical protein EW146_g8977 [Bondarzewia mesenterica]
MTGMTRKDPELTAQRSALSAQYRGIHRVGRDPDRSDMFGSFMEPCFWVRSYKKRLIEVEWLHRLPSAVHRLAAFASYFVEHFGRVPRRFHNPEDTHAGSNYPPIPRFKSTREYERSGDDKLPFILTYAEMKLLGIASVFFVDGAFRFRICVYVPYVRALNLTATAYDLFIINPVATMLQFHLYGAEPRPAGLEGFVKAAANIGSVIGQSAFGEGDVSSSRWAKR